ncbi:MAG: EamA family transporter [Marmoricola sp.]
MHVAPSRPAAAPALVVTALLVVYVVWGSTYLAIRVTVEQAPPQLGMGARYVAAGLLLGLLLTFRGGLRRLRVTRRELAGCAFMGLMLPVLGNGLVALGESRGTPSGVAAVLVALSPLMIALFRASTGDRPRAWSAAGILVGLAGVAWLVLAGHSQGDVPLLPSVTVLIASTCWAFGSWWQPRLTLPREAFVMTVHEMWTGGVMLLVLGWVRGERLHPAAYDAHTWLAWSYLVVLGSMVAFTAYVWLLSNAPISLVATYAYVNPVVAVALGALLLHEPVTSAVLIGSALIVLGVATVITVERPRKVGVDEQPAIS